jgi:cysteine synthase A
LKEKNPAVEIIAVEPDSSAVLSGGDVGRHAIQGIGAGFVPEILNLDILDRIIRVTDEDAIETARKLASMEGILCGISSGANVWAALELARDGEYSGKCIVAVVCDTGERYLSTKLFK